MKVSGNFYTHVVFLFYTIVLIKKKLSTVLVFNIFKLTDYALNY